MSKRDATKIFSTLAFVCCALWQVGQKRASRGLCEPQFGHSIKNMLFDIIR